MAQTLVIVESPAKAKTINKYLGKDYKVMASVGHIKDLPKGSLGVDIEHDFDPQYDVLDTKNSVIKDIRKAAKNAKAVYLASDPDREGEAIAMHLAEEIQRTYKGEIYRLLLYEITKGSILKNLENPTTLNYHKYDAQKARRVLDRLVGYQISPILWEKVRYGLSAGRVQSVAVRLVCEREKEIQAFVTEEYWSVLADMLNQADIPIAIKLSKKDGKAIKIPNEETAKAIEQEAKQHDFSISKITKKKRQRQPVAPFITSSLQQEATRKLSMSSSRTMRVAQQLYEGVNEEVGGLITYMRTDSVRISDLALGQVREHIKKAYGSEFVPKSPRQFKSKKSGKIQDAHEAIRPTNMEMTPAQTNSILDRDQQRLYELIWNRFVASQMAAAEFDQTQVEITNGPFQWRLSGSVLAFPGFLKLYEEGKDDSKSDQDEQSLPPMQEGETLKLKQINLKQHFTEPPPRYSAPTLIKELEEQGIGRPSTFATIMETITKHYVEAVNGRFHPTPIGMLVNDLLVENFPDVLDVSFTANLETILDQVEEGSADWVEEIKKFYSRFSHLLDTARVEMKDIKKMEIPTDIVCDNCGSLMVIKWGKNGEFLGCSNYPECKTTGEFELDESGKPRMLKPEIADTPCSNCGSQMVLKHGKYGKFLACTNYPACKTTMPLEQPELKQVEGTCEECGSALAERRGRYGVFVACVDYPTCNYVKKKANLSTNVGCPKCKEGDIMQRRSKRGKTFFSCSNYPKCDYAMWDRPVERTCSNCSYPVMGERINQRGHKFKCPSCNHIEDADNLEAFSEPVAN